MSVLREPSIPKGRSRRLFLQTGFIVAGALASEVLLPTGKADSTRTVYAASSLLDRLITRQAAINPEIKYPYDDVVIRSAVATADWSPEQKDIFSAEMAQYKQWFRDLFDLIKKTDDPHLTQAANRFLAINAGLSRNNPDVSLGPKEVNGLYITPSFADSTPDTNPGRAYSALTYKVGSTPDRKNVWHSIGGRSAPKYLTLPENSIKPQDTDIEVLLNFRYVMLLQEATHIRVLKSPETGVVELAAMLNSDKAILDRVAWGIGQNMMLYEWLLNRSEELNISDRTVAFKTLLPRWKETQSNPETAVAKWLDVINKGYFDGRVSDEDIKILVLESNII